MTREKDSELLRGHSLQVEVNFVRIVETAQAEYVRGLERLANGQHYVPHFAFWWLLGVTRFGVCASNLAPCELMCPSHEPI
jgi:hypothetical protein